MSPLTTVQFMKGLVKRDDPARSKKTNWGKTLGVVLLTALATAGTLLVFGKLIALGAGTGTISGSLAQHALVKAAPVVWKNVPSPVWLARKLLKGIIDPIRQVFFR